jgi:hypothetical protein
LEEKGANMTLQRRSSFILIPLLFLLGLILPIQMVSAADQGAIAAIEFPSDLQSYDDAGRPILERLDGRIKADPFNLVGTLIFLLAVCHTFLCTKFTAAAHRLEHEHEEKRKKGEVPRTSVSHKARLMHFFGEVEVVFGLWAVTLLFGIVIFFDWHTAVEYVSHKVVYTEAIFVVVIMTLASTRPILKLAETFMSKVAGLLGGSLAVWWILIITLGPLLGSFITEPAAMTISAMLLIRKFYVLEPSNRLKYATLGLLFVNVSVGGTLTHFAAPPVLMVAEPWGWDMGFMLGNFGWKAVMGIFISNALYWFFFRKELSQLQERFTVRSLKEEILTKYFSREEMESELNAVIDEVHTQGEMNERVRTEIEKYTQGLEERLKTRYLEHISGTKIDLDLAKQAFTERFAEVKLYRLQQEVPKVLAEEERAPFQDPNWDQREDSVPAWVTAVHVFFMAWTIVNAHHSTLFVAGLLFFLGFAVVTADYQNKIDLQSPLLVGFFLGGLVTIGGVQGWWIEPVLGSLGELPLISVSTLLTAFNDNAAITYLATLIPGLTEELKYAVVAGAVAGGGLTVIANAPNPAGQALLKPSFKNGISPLGLLKGSLIPTLIMFVIFVVFR